MPMFQHRPALAAILVAFVAVLALSTAPVWAASPTPSAPSMNPIAATAVSYNGTWQGQCWEFVKKVVREATGREMGFDYRQGFFDAGAVEVSWQQAQSGDIIQIVRDTDTSPDADYPGLHTAIVLENLGNGGFNVIDSNRDFDGMVNLRPGYVPTEIAARAGLNYHIYRIGGAAPGIAPKVAPVPGQKFKVGDHAVTVTPGETLRLRSAPGTSSPILAELSDGTPLAVVGETIEISGYHWVKVSSPRGTGWVASEFMAQDAAAHAAAPTASGTPKPALPFRSFVPLVSTN